MADYAREYTPELTKEMLAGRLGDIEGLAEQEEGRAVSNAYSRGLGGQAMMGSMIGSVRSGAMRHKAQTVADFNAMVAGLKREERLTGEARAYETEENRKNREFQEKMAKWSFFNTLAHEANMMRAQNVASQQGAVVGGMTSLIGGALVGGISGGIARCDRSLKKNIRKVGTVGPVGLYEFDYRTDEHPGMGLPSGRRSGPMAQEVEKFFPAAVVVDKGFRAVVRAPVLGVL